jgi:muramoyltetrapeptide carboxypeptidase LdcA involved in peptidoglycan recycling
MGATLQDRAQDLMNAFSDPANKAVISSIGGNDQIRLLKHLDPQIFLENPKPFLGYSDNTNLALYLWRLGIPSYYGGAVMCQFGLSGAMQALTVEGVNRALFKNGRFEIKPSANYTDRYHNWEDVAALSKAPIESPSEGWYWDGESVGEGILWGGCLEILAWQLEVNAWLPKPESLKGCILCLETSEEMPPAHFVERTIVSLGERGLLENFSGLLMARPKAWEHEHPLTAAQSEAYRAAQRDAVQRAFRLYNKSAPLVMNVEFGHTDPQHILPIGQKLEIDAISKRVWAHY